METFAEKKIKYWTEDYTKEIKKLENKKNKTKEEEKLLIKIKKQRKNQISNLIKQYKFGKSNLITLQKNLDTVKLIEKIYLKNYEK
jgi:NhaP-type Na+/H+ and K+/H+ antiporter